MPPAPLPDWLHPAEKALREAVSRVRMIASTTPIDLAVELERLTLQWQQGQSCAPRFSYPTRQSHDEIITSLQHLADELQSQGPLGAVYADRAREIAIEAAICSAVGTSALRSQAQRRFSRRDVFDIAADKLANDWLDQPFPAPEIESDELVRSDDPRDPRSLLVRLKAEIGNRKLPFRVVVARDSSALAATGESFVQIAAARLMTVADVERTVLHEIEGHVVPRSRANAQPLGIFAIGTRFGVDDQEGRALCLERRTGHLRVGRRRELALRHRAARMLERGADFVETTQELLDRGAQLADALRITARIFRGGGLGREIVYLPAFLRVDAALSQFPDLDDVLAAGRVSIEAARLLRPWVEKMH